MSKDIEQNNIKQLLPEFIGGSAGFIEFDFIQGKQERNEQSKEEWFAIVCHPHPVHGGTKDNKVVHTLCRAWRDQGVHCLRFNFRGVGGSEGVFDEGRGEYDDLCSVINFVKARYGVEKKILLAGFSFGAYIAAKYASLKAVDALVLIAPPVQYPDFVKRDQINCSLLVVQGDEDEIVTLKLVSQWITAGVESLNCEEFQVIREAGHFFHGRLGELKMSVQEYFLGLK